jgi:predicted branched-subunit amino acid permease
MSQTEIATASATSPQKFKLFGLGWMALLPLHLGVVPFGIVYGIAGIKIGLSPWLVLGMSSIVFGGASQLLFVQMLAAGTPWLVIVLSITTINLRHMLYSLHMAPYWHHLSQRWKVLLAYLLTDEAYAITSKYYNDTATAQNKPSDYRHWYHLGSGLCLWVGWQISTVAGLWIGQSLPTNWPLGFAVPLTFIAIVIPLCKRHVTPKLALSVACTVGGIAILAIALPFKLGMIIASVAGISMGVFGSKLLVSRTAAQQTIDQPTSGDA